MEGDIENVILGCLSEEQFVKEVWGIRVFHSKKCFNPVNYFTLDELTDLLRESGLIRYGATTVGKEKRAKYQPYKTHFDVGKLKELQKLYVVESLYDVKACFDDGRGVLAHRLERFLPLHHKLRTIYNYLLEITGCVREELVVAAFLTPPYSSTFDWHTDSDHVFTMQIEGEKKWEIKMADGLIETYHLSPGDVFYVPADFPHRVISGETTSLSISYVVIPKTYTQIFRTALLKKLEQDLNDRLRTRKPLPFRWKQNHTDIGIDEVSGEIFRKYGLGEEDFRRTLISEYAADSISYLDQTWQPNFLYTDKNLELNTQLQKSSKGSFSILKGASENEILVVMNGRPSLALSSKLDEAVRFLNDMEGQFRCYDLPDCYTENSKLMICNILLKAGFVDFL